MLAPGFEHAHAAWHKRTESTNRDSEAQHALLMEKLEGSGFQHSNGSEPSNVYVKFGYGHYTY